jgi:hypothetical protein
MANGEGLCLSKMCDESGFVIIGLEYNFPDLDSKSTQWS